MPRGAIFFDAEYSQSTGDIMELCLLGMNGEVLVNHRKLHKEDPGVRYQILERTALLMQNNYVFTCGVAFDKRQMRRAFKQTLPFADQIEPRFVNIQSIEAAQSGNRECLSLRRLAEAHGLQAKGWHRAHTDAVMTREVYLAQSREFGFDPSDMPALLERLATGARAADREAGLLRQQNRQKRREQRTAGRMFGWVPLAKGTQNRNAVIELLCTWQQIYSQTESELCAPAPASI